MNIDHNDDARTVTVLALGSVAALTDTVRQHLTFGTDLDPMGVTNPRPYTPQEDAAADVRAAERQSAFLQDKLEVKAREFFSKGGRFDAELQTDGSPVVAWDGATPGPSLVALSAMTPAQITTVGAAKVLAQTLRLLTVVARGTRVAGKLAVRAYDGE